MADEFNRSHTGTDDADAIVGADDRTYIGGQSGDDHLQGDATTPDGHHLGSSLLGLAEMFDEEAPEHTAQQLSQTLASVLTPALQHVEHTFGRVVLSQATLSRSIDRLSDGM